MPTIHSPRRDQTTDIQTKVATTTILTTKRSKNVAYTRLKTMRNDIEERDQPPH